LEEDAKRMERGLGKRILEGLGKVKPPVYF
jgi:hypothetical protein